MTTEAAPIEVKEVVPEVFEFHTNRSRTIGKLVAALCKAQLDFGPVVKSSVNPQFRSKYADLATIINATMPALAKNELAIIQTPHVSGRELTMTTMLVHSSDEWISNDLTMPATMRNELTAQTIGSAVTYSRRYALQSILGIAADVDDDGTEASGGGTHEAAQDVAKRKIAELEAKKAEKAPQKAPIAPKGLTFTYPERHNGNFAEFTNINEYAASLDSVAQEGLRQVFKPFLSSSFARSGASIVAKEKMPALLEKLAGDCGIEVQEYRPNANGG